MITALRLVLAGEVYLPLALLVLAPLEALETASLQATTVAMKEKGAGATAPGRWVDLRQRNGWDTKQSGAFFSDDSMVA